ncbi:aromatic acid exporter family protein, partial [Streptomyces rubiginosohelvolus]
GHAQDLGAGASTVKGIEDLVRRIMRYEARFRVVRDAPERGSAVPVAVRESVRLVATDILVFAGADADEAERAVRDGSTDITVERRARPGV